MRCPQCGYLPLRDKQDSMREINSWLRGWPRENADCLLNIIGPRIRQLENEHYHSDLLAFLRSMGHHRITSGEVLRKLSSLTRDPKFMDILKKSDRPWPYLTTTIMRSKRSNG